MTDKRVIVIGLDGATWDLIKPWAEKGILPTFRKLMETGVYGNLESTIPPITGPAWVSFATGKNPGKHGCYDFLIPRNSLNDLRPITTKDIHEKTFYEILNETGKKCILINLPCSFPPRINDIIITSLLTQGDDFIFPPELLNEIPEFKNYRISPDMSLHVNEKIIDYVNDIRKLEKNRLECAKKLFEYDWDFFFLLFSGTDWIQHKLYDKLVSGAINDDSDSIKAYKEIDNYIGWFVDNVPQDINILFMSDHGFKVYKKEFSINGWLRKEGYLVIEPRSKLRAQPQKLAENIEKARSKRINIKLPFFVLKYLKLFTWLFPFYMKLREVLPIEIRTDLQPKLSETIAYSITSVATNFCGIYINNKKRFVDGKVEIDDYENIRIEIINKLKQLKNPKTGENAIKKIWKKEEVYFGSQLTIAPDIFFMLLDNYKFNHGFSSKIFIDKIIGELSGHALEGIFIAYGPDIKKGVEIQNAKIYDLAPTILHLFGLQIPKDMDGKVLKEIFKGDSELAKREIEYQEEADEKESVKEKIKKLKEVGKI